MISSILLFLLGLCIGSFLNVLIAWSVGKRESFVSPSSFCDHCRKPLAFWDLIPLFSFLSLRGRCRYCGKRISFQYPLVELTAGILFALAPLSSYPLPFSLFLLALFTVIFVTDLKYGVIPDRVVLPATILALPYSVFVLGHSPIIPLAVSSFFFFLYFVSRRRALGLGDVKLSFFLGLTLNWPYVILAMWIAFVVGGVVAFILLILGRKKLKDEIPLGPFLVVGGITAVFLGDSILRLLSI